MLKTNPYLDKMELSVIRQIAEECNRINREEPNATKKIINMTIGEPDIKPHQRIIDETIEYMKTSRLGYPPVGGLLELRQEIAKDQKAKYGVNVTADEVIINVGTTEALSTALRTILEPGDEVIIPLPAYPGYKPLVFLNGGKYKTIDTSDSNYEITAEKIRQNLSPNTKAIILNYPTNPTGVVISKKNRDEILKLAKEKNLYILSDEVYCELVYNGEHHTFLDNDYRDNVIIVNGFSKSHSMTGWRVGYTICSAELKKKMIMVHQYSVTAIPIMSQYGAIVALQKCQDLSDRIPIYKERADSVYEALKKIGFKPIKPNGAIYMFSSVKDLGIKNTYQFAMDLLREEKVAVVPGSGFEMEGYIRISLVQDSKIMLEGINRIENFLKKYKQI
ncbi:MAG: pyridoxal phosphate-dependent aminotransferase [Fusobacteriaceae bacterium]